MQNRLQAKIDIKVHIPTDIGSLPESIDLSEIETQICDWQLYKTQTKASTGHSKVETQKLEKLVTLYQKSSSTRSFARFTTYCLLPFRALCSRN